MTDAEQYAQQFLDVADAIGQAITRTETLARLGGLKGEERAADSVLISGPEVMEALRQIAFRLDRAALYNRPEWRNTRDGQFEQLAQAIRRFVDLSPVAVDTSELEEALEISKRARARARRG